MPVRLEITLSSRSPALRVLAVGVALGLAIAPVPVLAAPATTDEAVEKPDIDTEARAMTAYRAGQEAYDAGDYGEALQQFLEAQSLYPSPDFHYNVGRCHEALENPEQASISYQAYLRSYNTAYGEYPDDRINIENKIDRLDKQVEADRALAEANANKQPEIIIQTVPGERPPPPPGRVLIITGGVLAGVGVGVAVAGAAVFGTRAAGFSSELDDVYSGNPKRVTLEQAQEIDADGRAAELNQILMLSIGSAIAVTGVALLAVGLVKKKKGPAPTITPTAGPQGAGLLIQGKF